MERPKILVWMALLAALAAACGKKSQPGIDDCCNLTGQALPLAAQQALPARAVHNPVTVTLHQLDPDNLLLPEELAAEETVPLAGPRFADDETDNRYTIPIPPEATGVRDLVIAARQGDVFAGATVVPAPAEEGSVLVARPLVSSSRYETEAYIRGLAALGAGETLDDNLWSFWSRMGFSLPLAQAMRAAFPTQDDLDALALMTILEQQSLLQTLEPVWTTPPEEEVDYVLDPLEERLRALASGYDALEDQRLDAGLEQGAMDEPYRQDVVRVLTEQTTLQTDATQAADLVQSLIARRLLIRLGNMPATLYPNDAAATLELRKQESLVVLESHPTVIDDFEETFDCPTCLEQDIVGFGRQLFHDIEYTPAGAPAEPIAAAWVAYRGQLNNYVSTWLVTAVDQQASDDFNLAVNNLDQPAGVFEQLAAAVDALEVQSEPVTHEDAEALLSSLRADVDTELANYFPDAVQRAALTRVILAMAVGQTSLSETYVGGGT